MKEIKINDCIKYITDYHANGSYENLKKNVTLKHDKNYAIMIRTLNFERKDFQKDLLYLDKDEYEFLSKSKVYANDILINKIANPGSVYLMPNLGTPVSCGMNLFVLRFDDSIVNQKYMFYNMKNRELYIKSLAHGTTTKTITKDDVRGIELFIHPREEQDQIAKLLSTIDSKIANNEAIVQRLEAMVKTIYDYWFLQFEFPNEEGKPYKSSGGKMVWNEELQQDIPEGWGSAKLKDVIVENPKSKIKVGDVKNIGEVPFFTSGAEILSTNDSIVSGLNCYLNTGGNADVKYYYGEASYSTDTWCITARDDMKYILPFILDKIKPSMDKVFFQGTGLRHLQKNLLREYSLCIPDNDVLKKFEKIARDIFVQQHNLLAENRKLESLKEFLLPLLMNGQVTVGE